MPPEKNSENPQTVHTKKNALRNVIQVDENISHHIILNKN